MKTTNLLKHRTQLLERLTEIEQAISGIKTELSESSQTQTNFLQDCLDHAREQTELGSRIEIYDRYLKERSRILAALHRMDKGSFGDCRECGDKISERRLMVQPSASLCLECQSQKEVCNGLETLSVLKLNLSNTIPYFVFGPEAA